MYSQLPRGDSSFSRACATCYKRKIRCDLRLGGGECMNCRSTNQNCRPRQRKRRHDSNEVLNPDIDNNEPKDRPQYSPTPFAPSSPALEPVQPGPSLHTTEARPTAAPFPEKVGSSSGSYLGRAEYLGGAISIDEEYAKDYPLPREEQPGDIELVFLQRIDAFELPPRSVRDSLFTNFLERCLPWMPIVEKADLYAVKPSILLLQSVFVAGSRISTAPHAQVSGQTFYRRAKALYYADIERDPLVLLRALCILQWWNPCGPEHVSMNASSFWLHMSVAIAFQIGLHREPDPARRDATVRRKLWWTLFTRDCMISVSHGRPRALNLKDSDVRKLTLADFPNETADGNLFIAYVDICTILADITELSVQGTLGRSQRLAIEDRLLGWIRDLPPNFHLYDRRTGALADYNFKARQLHVPYFTAVSVLYRPLHPGGNPSIATLLASSFTVSIYEDFIARGEIPMLASVFIFHLMASALAQLPNRKYEQLWAKTELELRIITQALEEFSKRFPTAIGALRVVDVVTKTVLKEQPQPTIPQLSGSSDQLRFFSSFGPELCGKWTFAHSTTEYNSAADKTTTTVPQSQTSKIAAAHTQEIGTRSYHSQKPVCPPTMGCAENEHAAPPMTLFRGQHQLSYLDGMVPESFANFQTGLSGLGPETVGNWILADWME